MAKPKKPLAEKGAENAADLYTMVGVALSWWEASEDIILGLYRRLCGQTEPLAMEAFIDSPRGRRTRMLRSALQAFQHRLLPEEIKVVEKSLAELDKLAQLRNEIAHGHVSKCTMDEDGRRIAEGNYLLPSLNENGPHERGYRYHHTLETLERFVADVRKWRGDILDVDFALLGRDNEKEFSPEYHGCGYMLRFISQKIARYELSGSDAIVQLADLLKRIEQGPVIPPPPPDQ